MKIVIDVEENVKCRHAITVELDKAFDETKLNDTLDEAQAYSHSLHDVMRFLDIANYNVIEFQENDICDSNDVEIEITDFEIT